MAAMISTIAPVAIRAPQCLARSASRVTAALPSSCRALTKPYSGLSGGAGLRRQVQLGGSRPAAVQLVRGRPSLYRPIATAAVAVGTKLPEADLSYFDNEGNLQTVSTEQLTKGKKVVLFAVPGAFTPTCSQKHLPGFIEKADELRAKGVDTVACISVNDPFVMRAWGEASGAAGKVLMLADGSALFTKALGVSLDLTDKGLGVRSRRYALLADDGVVKSVNLEEGGAFTVSGPDEILKALA